MQIFHGNYRNIRMVLLRPGIFLMIFNLLSLIAHAQQVQYVNLPDLFVNKKVITIHRTAAVFTDKNYTGIEMDEQSQDGIVWLNGLNFSKGVIDVDIKGRDAFQKSFVGIAFHGLNDSTYDAVYFRPFNFRANDSVRRIHAVQYISHPTYTWKYLRDTQNAKFENTVLPVPDPNDWFHVKIEVSDGTVRVFVNNAGEPSLRVFKLNDRLSGKLGLWAGEGSGGQYANLVIRHW